MTTEPQEFRIQVAADWQPVELVIRLSIAVEPTAVVAAPAEEAVLEPVFAPTPEVPRPTKADIVADLFYQRLATGRPVVGLNITQLAKDVFGDQNSRPTVSRVWNACLRGEYRDPKPGGRYEAWELWAS